MEYTWHDTRYDSDRVRFVTSNGQLASSREQASSRVTQTGKVGKYRIESDRAYDQINLRMPRPSNLLRFQILSTRITFGA